MLKKCCPFLVMLTKIEPYCIMSPYMKYYMIQFIHLKTKLTWIQSVVLFIVEVNYN